MTDEEMAVELGEEILNLQHETVILRVILDQMRQPDGSAVPWREMKEWDLPQLKQSPTSQEKFDELRQAIHARLDHSPALLKLYRHFLK